ncbi:MAG TPA: hypothetical protein VM184_10225 [Gaiellaceae bacterium]|nr:hypothetical protein [Gaiellaceae bacterium]
MTAATAFAQSPASDAYGDQLGGSEARLTGGEAGAASLPFTGLDIGLMVAAGLAIAVTGLLLRRFGRKPA